MDNKRVPARIAASVPVLTGVMCILATVQAWACTVCRENQPAMLKDITHGAGPQGNWDYIIIWSAVVVVAVTLFFSIRFLASPKETASDHIKNIVVEKR